MEKIMEIERNLLCEAITNCARERVEFLIEALPNPHRRLINSNIDDEGRTPLTLALECTLMSCTDQEELKTLMNILVNKGATLDLHDERGVSPIHAIVISEAPERDKIGLIKKLLIVAEGSQLVPQVLNKRVETDRRMEGGELTVREGDTALHLAVRNRNIDVVNELIGQEHIDPNILNTEGKTPAHIAADSRDKKMIAIYRRLATVSQPDIADYNDKTAIEIYAFNNPDTT